MVQYLRLPLTLPGLIMALWGLATGAPLSALEEITPKHQKSMERATAWLLKAQNPDGSWGMDHRTTADIACTSVSGLALLSAGNTDRDGPDPACVKAVKNAVDYLLKRAKKTRVHGDIAEGERTQIHTYVGQRAHTFFAVQFLSQVYGMQSPEFSREVHQEIREALQKLTDSIAVAQDSDGSWHKETYSGLQSTALAWLALRSSSSTGISIKHAIINRTLKFIRQQYDSGSKLYALRGRNNGNVIYDSASAIRILYGMGLREEPQTRAAVDALLQMLTKAGGGHHFLTATGEDYPAAVMLTHALSQEGGARWTTWFRFLGNRLFQLQNADGSWTSSSCLVGRTFVTACALSCLQTPLHLLPNQDL